MAGKGSKQRPLGKNTTQKQFDDNWDKIFNSKKSKPNEDSLLDVYNDARLSTVTDEQTFGKPVDSK